MENDVGNNSEENLAQENKNVEESDSSEGAALSSKKKKEAMWGDELENNDVVCEENDKSNSSMSRPLGFRSFIKNGGRLSRIFNVGGNDSKQHGSKTRSVNSKNRKQSRIRVRKVDVEGVSIVDSMVKFIEVCSALGYKTTGCNKNLESIIKETEAKLIDK